MVAEISYAFWGEKTYDSNSFVLDVLEDYFAQEILGQQEELWADGRTPRNI